MNAFLTIYNVSKTPDIDTTIYNRICVKNEPFWDKSQRVMKILLFILIFTFSIEALIAQKTTPFFRRYPVKEMFNGKPARLNLNSSAQVRLFRTMLSDIAKKGANFAGHYAVGYWGCGTECIRIGVVNLKTGRAYVSPFYASVGISFRKKSRLLIVAPEEQIRELYNNAAPDYLHPRYYIVRDDKLVLIHPKSDIGKKGENYWK